MSSSFNAARKNAEALRGIAFALRTTLTLEESERMRAGLWTMEDRARVLARAILENSSQLPLAHALAVAMVHTKGSMHPGIMRTALEAAGFRRLDRPRHHKA